MSVEGKGGVFEKESVEGFYVTLCEAVQEDGM